MARSLTFIAAMLVSFTALAQSTDAVLDAIIKDSKSNFEKLTALDKSDKDLKMSNAAQTFSSQQADKLEREAKQAMGPLQMDANRADQFRKQVLAAGCPEHGGVVDLALAQRCNPLISQHRAMADAIRRRAEEVKAKNKTAATLREGVTKTTLKNTEQQKKNNEARSALTAQRLAIQTRAVVAGLRNKAAAAKACSSMGSAEGQVCCGKVVMDGADPKTCGVELVCQAFERGGLLGTGGVVCRVSANR